MTIQILIFICFVDSFLILMSQCLLMISGSYVLVLSVTNLNLSYSNTEIDKSMIFSFTNRIHIPHCLRNLQRCEHDAFSYLTSSSCSLIWETFVKWGFIIFELCIFAFFNWFLNVTFLMIFFPSYKLVIV